MMPVTHVISVPLGPADASAASRLSAALDEMRAADAALGVEILGEDQIVIEGITEAHLEWVVWRLRRDHDIAFQVGHPRVAYREIITNEINWTYTHQQREPREFARLTLRLTPLARGAGLVVENRCTAAVLPPVYFQGSAAGIRAACAAGIIAGSPVVDLQVAVVDAACHEAGSSAAAFRTAAMACMCEALFHAHPVLLEPMMLVVVLTPSDFLDLVLRDLKGRQGRALEARAHGAVRAATALVPFANMFGYENALRSMTRETASFTMAFARYEQVATEPRQREALESLTP